MKTTRFVIVLAAMLCGTFFAQAQPKGTPTKPRVSVTFEGGNAGNLAATDPQNLVLSERKATLQGVDTAFQAGNAVIRLDVPSQALLVVPYLVVYRDANGNILPNNSTITASLPDATLPAGFRFGGVLASTISPQPVAINTLQGDLSPRTRDNNGVVQAVNATTTTPIIPNSVNFQVGETQKPITFTARWSDQTWQPRTAGKQGPRTVTVMVLPDDVGSNYNLGVTIATVTLNDPANSAPRLINAIQDRLVEAGRSEVSELETPGLRGDGLVSSVFYDDEYNVMTYTASSSDTNTVRVFVTQNDARFQGRPSLSYQVNPLAPIGAMATVTVTANDGSGGVGIDDFLIRINSARTSVIVPPSEAGLNVYPNPSSDRLNVEARAQASGVARIKLSTPLGASIIEFSQIVRPGELYRQDIDIAGLPAGIYFVEIHDGAIRSVQKVVKN